ncbi:uncharacterized protein ACNLHF_009515 [Anomaloglossus baeobatrachus]|uniref:uncharacterized protein LOC142292137 n=1 Tax=Anomaloglossus baeobatrachus TaxID=238106 RepID=UPI003F4FDE56
MSRQDVCALCSSSEDSFIMGGLQRTEDGSLVGHYNCMLYSPKVIQNSQNDRGGFGFNVESMLSEIRRGKRLRCTYCKKKGATIGCIVKSCKRNYHYPCLLKADGTTNPIVYVAFCARHKNGNTTNDLESLKKGKSRKGRKKAASKQRNNNIGHQQDNNEPDQGAQQESPEEQEPQQESPEEQEPQQESPEEQEPQQESPEEQEPQQESPEEQEPQQPSLSPASLHDMAADSPSAGGARGSGWLLSQSSANEGEEIQNQNPTLEDLLASHRRLEESHWRQYELMEQHGVMLARFVAAQQQGDSY